MRSRSGRVLSQPGTPRRTLDANYAAGKFGLRGFTEAPRRELTGGGVTVTYVAPRATRTGLNSDAVYGMGEATGMHVDQPEAVATAIVRAILGRRREVFSGVQRGSSPDSVACGHV